MAKQTVESLVEGGKATAAPPLGPALGPLGVNIGQVVAEINKKTASFKGMQVPVKVIVDSDTKEFEVTVGTPPASSLIKKEAGLEKGASNPLTDKVADLKIEQIIKVAKMKEGALLGKDLKNKVKEIMGTCQSMGVKVEGVDVPEAIKQVNEGKFDEEIRTEKTELSTEEIKEQEEEKKRLSEELATKRAEFETEAKEIMAKLEGKESKLIRSKLAEAKIPQPIIDELVPPEKKEEGAAQ
ncbi:50S ribosomal protein L11 [Candidatus Woesearchaeota archaeon]|nr:50S ribosomal protein L11 [Candidatus Woesearchaeota archaeon]